MPLVLERSWIGRRVSVRRDLGHGSDGRAQFGDLVGDLVELDVETATIESRAGRVEVPLSTVVLARIAPPSTRDELDLEAILARGWRAAETSSVGGWLLRASGGFTGRANSVLPLGPPDQPLDDALAEAHAWYSARDLPLKVQVPTNARRLLDAGLAERGWPASPDVHIMAARLHTVMSRPGPEARSDVALELHPAPDDDWLARYRDGAGTAAAARGVLTRHERVMFAALRREGQVLAIGRGTVDADWLGVTAVEVDPAQRGQGLASAVMRALWRWGSAEGATRSHLEVSEENTAALAMYRQLGYWVHHDYRYRCAPST
jgi:ribosomal protein S18 acetylase RimI-like enzyme